MINLNVERLRKRLTAILATFWLAAATVVGTRWGETSLIGHTLFSSGCLLMGVGVIGRVWCLGTIAGHKTNDLITDGPYSLCQNPLYFFSAVGAVGVGMASCTFVFPLLVLLGFLVYYPSVISSEARRLTSRHGEAYLAYHHKTPLLIPSLARFRESGEHHIASRAFRRGAFDTVWFFVAFAWMHVLTELHRSGHFVTWYVVP